MSFYSDIPMKAIKDIVVNQGGIVRFDEIEFMNERQCERAADKLNK